MTVLAAPALSPVKKREGNIELLRIVCMLMIIAHHLAYHGVAMHAPLRTNKVLATVLFSGGMTGVNSFVLITGYFLAPFRAKRLVSILLQTLFYSVGLTLLCRWTGWRQDVTDDAVLRSAFVLARSPYWFVTMYAAMTALLPLLQPAVQRLGKRAHAWVLAVAALYLCVIPTLTFQDPASPYFHQLIWFFFLYVLGAFFRKYPSRVTRCMPLHAAVFALSLAFIALSCLWGEEHAELFQRVGSRHNFFADKNTIPQLICSCALFLFFANLRVSSSALLTVLSGASFGVYLIHDHSLMRDMIWRTWLQIWTLCQRGTFWLWALLIPPGIYLACALADCLRKYVLETPLMKLLSPACQWLDEKLSA